MASKVHYDICKLRKLPDSIYHIILELDREIKKLPEYKSVSWRQFFDGNIVINIKRKTPLVVKSQQVDEDDVLKRLEELVK